MKKLLSIVLTLVLLLSVFPMAIGTSAAEATDPAYKFLFDAGEKFRTSYDSGREANATIKFDYYLKSGSVKVYGSEDGNEKGYLQEGVNSFELNVSSKSFWFEERISAEAELYIWNVELTQGGSALDFASYSGRTTCEFQEITYGEIPFPEVEPEEPEAPEEPEFVGSGDYAILVDNSANTIQSDPIWFNELSMPMLSLDPGKTYTLKFDNYALNVSTGGHLYHPVNSTGGSVTGQNWWNTTDALNAWATQSVTFTIPEDKEALAYHRLYVGAGFKGYVDNFRVYDGETEVAKLEFDSSNLGKTSAAASIVELSAELAYAKNYDYAMYIDNSANSIQSNQIWFNGLGMSQLSLAPGKTYTLKFDNYALSQSTSGHCYIGVHGTGGGITGQNWWNTEDKLEGWATQSVQFTVSGDQALAYHTLHVGAGFKGYLDNFRVYDGETEVALLEFDASCLGKSYDAASVVVVPYDVAMAKNAEEPEAPVEPEEPEVVPSGDYAIYIDNSANSIQSDPIWFNELSMPMLSLDPGKTYTLKFDNYALNVSTGGHLYHPVNSTGGSVTGQNWWNTSDALNDWATQSVTFTIPEDKEALAYHRLYVGAGFKGYVDNFRVYDGETEVARLEFDSSNLDKTSAGATVVELPSDIAAAKTAEYAYKMEMDVENEFFRTAYDGNLGNGATISFDYYLVSGKVKVDGTNDSGAYLNLGVGSFELSVPVSKSFTITSRSADFVELYIWNIKITQAGTTLDFNSYEGRTNCEWEKILLSDVPEYVEKDYGMLVDTTSLATDGAANKAFWFNTLGMASYNNTLTAGETYTFAFDVYPLEFVLTQNVFHFRTSSGSSDVWGGFWKATDLVKNQWNTTSTTFTVDDVANTGNHILFVYGGFKGYIDNVRIIDSQGNVVAGTSHNFNGLTVPADRVDFITIDALSDEIIAAKEPCIHTYKYTTQDSTCSDPGFTKYVCSLCGGVANEEPIGVKDHTYDNDCDAECNVCGGVREVGDHVYENYVSNNDATCTANGTETGKCVCGATDTREVADSKLEHTYENYTSNNDATCTANGTETGKCVCGATDTREDADSKLEHEYKDYKSNNDATCTKNGTETGKCVCGAEDTREVADSKLEHEYKNYVSNNDATCTANGTETGKCVCGAEDTREVADSKLDHAYDNACDTDCNACGDVREIEHIYDNEEDYFCNVCGICKTLEPTLIKGDDSVWRYYVDGKWDETATTLHKLAGKWFYVEDGIWSKATRLVEYQGKIFYVKGGKWDSTIADTLYKIEGKWYYIVNGKLAVDQTTMVKYQSKWFYVEEGKLSLTSRFVVYKGVTFYIKGGKWDKTLNTLIKKDGKYVAVKSGKLYEGKAIITYKGKKFYVNKGYAQLSYSGKVTISGKKYTIKKGKVA